MDTWIRKYEDMQIYMKTWIRGHTDIRTCERVCGGLGRLLGCGLPHVGPMSK